MENIVQVVEGAVGAAEAEAKKIETGVATDVKTVETDAARLEGKIADYFQAAGHLATYEVHAVTKAAIAEFSKVTNSIEHTRVALELEHLVHEIRHPETAIDPAVTQAKKDAEEDAETVRGAFSRFVHRVWEAI